MGGDKTLGIGVISFLQYEYVVQWVKNPPKLRHSQTRTKTYFVKIDCSRALASTRTCHLLQERAALSEMKVRKPRAELEQAEQARKEECIKETKTKEAKGRGAGGATGEAEDESGGKGNSAEDGSGGHREVREKNRENNTSARATNSRARLERRWLQRKKKSNRRWKKG